MKSITQNEEKVQRKKGPKPLFCARQDLILIRAGQFSHNTKIDAHSVTPRENNPPDCFLTRVAFKSCFQWTKKGAKPLFCARQDLILIRAGQFSHNTKIDAHSVTPRENNPPDCFLTRVAFKSCFQWTKKGTEAPFLRPTGLEPAPFRTGS